MGGYKDLRVWQLARDIVIEVHKMTMTLPKFEMYEEGAQIRKSSKNVKSTIVEGYGRRIYKAEYLKFLVYALASNDETRDHLETLYDTKSLTDEVVYKRIHGKISMEGKELHDFYIGVEKNHIPRL
jgi:four helix bundle protein